MTKVKCAPRRVGKKPGPKKAVRVKTYTRSKPSKLRKTC